MPVTWKGNDLKKMLQEGGKRLVEKSAYEVLRDAIEMAPVDTGALIATARVLRTKNGVMVVFGGKFVGVDGKRVYVDYAVKCEVRTPFIIPAVIRNKGKIEDNMAEILTVKP